MGKNLIIHIGLHKTGTTYLQYNLFPRLEDTIYIHGNRFFQQWSKQSIQSNESCLWSYEGFSGVAWTESSLRMRYPNNSGYWIKSFEENINNLKVFFPGASIICVFRKPGDLVLSMYKQYIHEGGILSFKDFYGSDGVIGEQDLALLARVDLLKKSFDNCYFFSYQDFLTMGDKYFVDFFKTEFDLNIGDNPDQKSVKSNRSVAGWKLEALRRTNIYYGHFPSSVRKSLRRLRWSPRDIFQNRLSTFNAKDNESLVDRIKEINHCFSGDWDVFEKQYQWKVQGFQFDKESYR